MASYGVRLVNEEAGIKNDLKADMTYEEATKMRDELNANMAKVGMDTLKAVRFAKMNQHEKVINQLVRQCVSEWIGGLENTMQDYTEDTEEYQNAKAMLNHDDLFNMFYSDIMAETKRNAKSHLRFAGKKFIEERIENALEKCGYGK